MRAAVLVLYTAALVAANVITARTVPLEVNVASALFLIPWGTWLIGCTFVLRDLVQMSYGRRIAYAAIGGALVASAVTSALLGDTLAVVVGSMVAFGVSEATDTEVFTRLRARVPLRIAASGVIGSALDSCIFAVVALSPLWSGIVPWSALWQVIVGQFVVKAMLQVLAGGAWRLARGPEPLPEAAR